MCNEAIAFVPGRVELLGVILDYNQGLVLSGRYPLRRDCSREKKQFQPNHSKLRNQWTARRNRYSKR